MSPTCSAIKPKRRWRFAAAAMARLQSARVARPEPPTSGPGSSVPSCDSYYRRRRGEFYPGRRAQGIPDTHRFVTPKPRIPAGVLCPKSAEYPEQESEHAIIPVRLNRGWYAINAPFQLRNARSVRSSAWTALGTMIGSKNNNNTLAMDFVTV